MASFLSSKNSEKKKMWTFINFKDSKEDKARKSN